MNAQRRTTQTTAGTFAFARPGKFRWTYDKPFDQLIVGDGASVWVYDKDLNQVIVRKLDAALGATPAALLAGDNALERNFDLGRRAGGRRPRIRRRDAAQRRLAVQAHSPRISRQPAAGDDAGRRVRPDHRARRSAASSAIRRSPADLFRFTPPPGADVVGQPRSARSAACRTTLAQAVRIVADDSVHAGVRSGGACRRRRSPSTAAPRAPARAPRRCARGVALR